MQAEQNPGGQSVLERVQSDLHQLQQAVQSDQHMPAGACSHTDLTAHAVRQDAFERIRYLISSSCVLHQAHLIA